MLTGDLVRVRTQKQLLMPSYIDPGDERLLERAESLVEVFARALEEGWRRADITEAVKDIEGIGIDHKLTKGLAKVLFDRGTFDVTTDIPPAELRHDAFRRAAALGPIARHSGVVERRTARSVLAELAEERGLDPEQLRRGLYADLKDEQTLVAHDPLAPTQLLERYNLALVQAVLLKAESMTLRLRNPDAKHLRALFRRMKFHQLMFRVEHHGDEVAILLDGPESLLRRTTRYGMQLATFFPALPLLPTPWRVQALIRWGKRRLRKDLVVDHAQGLRSHYKARGVWKSQAEEWFEERFVALESGWSLEPGVPVDMGRQQMLVPDFTFRRDGRVAHLDIVGFWRKSYLHNRLRETPDHVVLAVSKRLAADKSEAMPKAVVPFAEIIPAKKVLEQIERVARPE